MDKTTNFIDKLICFVLAFLESTSGKLDKATNFIVMFVLTFLVSISASAIFTRVFDLEWIYALFIVSGVGLMVFVYYTIGRRKK